MSRKEFYESLERLLKDVNPRELQRLHDFISGWAMEAKAYIRKTYMCSDVVEYMARKYDIKGEIGIGEKDIRAGKRLP